MKIIKTAGVSVALASALALGLGACSDGTSTRTAPVAEAPQVSSPSESPTPPPAPPAAPVEATKMSIGAPVEVLKNGTLVGTVTVTGVKASKKNPSTYATTPPKNGMFWVVTISYQAAAGSANTWSSNPFDWTATDAEGVRYTQDFAGTDKALHSSELNAGQKNTGTIVFDAPAQGVSVSYKSSFLNRDLATLALVAS